MKKLLFLLSACLIGFSVYAEGDKPIVIIHKTNGGYWAWLNLYNDILYTPSLDENTPATLVVREPAGAPAECLGKTPIP